MKAFWHDFIKWFVIGVVSFLTLIYIFGSPPTTQQKNAYFSAENPKRYQEATLTLKRIYHHGSTKYPKLFRRLEINETLLSALEQSSGTKFTHTVRGVPGSVVKPLDATKVNEYRRRHKYDHFSVMMHYQEVNTLVPDMANKENIIELAKLTYDAYIPPTNDDWYDLGDKYQWKDEFGWEEDGLRGHVFADEYNKTVVIAIKGTTMIVGPTVPRDKQNDNRLFSCCCGRVGSSWTPVCPCYLGNENRCNQTCVEDSVDEDDLYFNIASATWAKIQDDFPNATVWLTGHSLGGSISSLIGWTYGIPTVSYEAPGDRLAAKRLHLPGPPALPYEQTPIWHIGHTADPLFMGSCTGWKSICWMGGYAMETHCHHGLVCLYDSVERLGWKPDTRTHRIKDVIEKVLEFWEDVPECKPEKDCEDCGWWNYE